MQYTIYNIQDAKRAIFILLLVVFGVVNAPFSFAQISEVPNTEEAVNYTIDPNARKEELRSQLKEVQAEIEKYREEILEKKKEEKTLNSEVAIIGSRVKKTELELTQTALALRATELSVEANKQKITELEEKIAHEKTIIAELMRMMYEEDSRDFVDLIMSSGDLSDFVEHQRFLENIQVSLQKALQNVKQAKTNVEQEQLALEDEREAQFKLKTLQEVQRTSLANQKAQRNELLNFTREEKGEFERLLAQKERDIAQIRSQIFLLEGVGISMPLHEAYAIAKAASAVSGVRPAFLLAVLKQESSWGENVGQCFLLNPETGEGVGKNTGTIYTRVMKASRDVQPFLQITEALGRDPYNTLVSCPHANYGYGGAMGPAQFLPSTWITYQERLTNLLGHTPDPWNVTDAFSASALKLANGGAAAQSYDAEWKAAMIYYAGGNWNNPVYAFYGDSVMELAAAIQEEISAMGG